MSIEKEVPLVVRAADETNVKILAAVTAVPKNDVACCYRRVFGLLGTRTA